MTPFEGAVILAWLVILLMSFSLAAVLTELRGLRQMLKSRSTVANTPVDRLEASSPLMSFVASATSDIIALFVTPGCASCAHVTSLLNGQPREVLVVSDGNCATGSRACISNGIDERLRLGIPATPYICLISPQGAIRAGTLATPDQVGEWLRANHDVKQPGVRGTHSTVSVAT